MSKIKIMHIIHGLSMGGAENLVKEYALKIDRNKFEIKVLCFHHYMDSPYEEMLKNKNIKIIYIDDLLKRPNSKYFFDRLINIILRYILIKRVIHDENPDIIHTHLTINRYVKFSHPKKNTKIFHTVHSEPKRYWPNNNNPDFKAAKYLVKKYNMRFICLHKKMLNEVNEMFGVNNSIILNNGIDLNRFNNLTRKEETRKILNINNDYFIIGHIGRFTKVKNHEFIVDVFSEIVKKNKKAYLLLIGSGENKEIKNKLNSLNLNNKYKILENRTDIPSLLKTMDIFIFPSIKEGIPISLIEAQESRIPCFISDGISSSAIISNIVTKISLKKSAEEWADIICKYNKPLNIEIYDEEWDISKITKKLEKIYESSLIKK